MLRDSFTNRWMIGGFCFLIVFAIACYFWYQHELAPYRQRAEKTSEMLRQHHETEQANTAQKRQVIGKPTESNNGQNQSSQAPNKKTETENETVSSTDADDAIPADLAGIPHVRGFTSTNPMFADGVPEHLQCPKKWVGLYIREADEDVLAHMVPIFYEIMTKYNPERPLTEVWPAYIEAERFYKANADPERGNANGGSGRFDWHHQNLLDFPEIMVLDNEDPDRSSVLSLVLLGDIPANWNQYKLPDGRILYEGPETNYRVVISEQDVFDVVSGKIERRIGSSSGFGHAGPDAPVITIYPDKITDEELKAIGGWNYEIDPYSTGLWTLPPDATQRFIERIKTYF